MCGVLKNEYVIYIYIEREREREREREVQVTLGLTLNNITPPNNLLLFIF